MSRIIERLVFVAHLVVVAAAAYHCLEVDGVHQLFAAAELSVELGLLCRPERPAPEPPPMGDSPV